MFYGGGGRGPQKGGCIHVPRHGTAVDKRGHQDEAGGFQGKCALLLAKTALNAALEVFLDGCVKKHQSSSHSHVTYRR